MLNFIKLKHEKKSYTTAPLLEQFITQELKLPFSTTDNNGQQHPGTAFNQLASRLIRMKVVQINKDDWIYIPNDQVNKNLLQELIEDNFIKITTIRSNKLDLYSFELVKAMILYLSNGDVTIDKTYSYSTSSEDYYYTSHLQPTTSATPLFSLNNTEEEHEISGTVISTFSEEEQIIIREYMQRCKNTYEFRKKKEN